MKQADHMPSKLALSRLVQELGNSGNVSGIQEVEELIKGKVVNLPTMPVVTRTAFAHIKR